MKSKAKLLFFKSIKYINYTMKSRTYQLSVFLESLASFHLEKAIFYTVVLRAGSKFIELPQKKCLTEENFISFLDTLTLKLTQNEVQNTKNQAQLQIYSVQKYGQLRLVGHCNFQIELTNRRQMKVSLDLDRQQKAQIKFSYGFFKTESRMSSQKSYKSSTNKYNFHGINAQIQLQLLSQLKQKQFNRQKQTPQKSGMQSENVSELYSPSSSDICQLLINSPVNFKTQNLQINEDQQQINLEQNREKKDDLILRKVSSLNTTYQQQLVSAFGLKIASRVVQFHTSNEKQSLAESLRITKQLLSGSSALSPKGLIQNISFGHINPLSQTQVKPKQKKVALIRPATRVASYEQLQNDDMNNVVHQMIDAVKGNVSHIKLSKLTQLSKKIAEIRNRNKFLFFANNQLIQNQKLLCKKLESLNSLIRQKEGKFEMQLNVLKKQIISLQKKLAKKQAQDKRQQQALKQALAKIQSYEKQVKNLQGQIQLKGKQVHHLKLLINAYEERQITTSQVRKEEPVKESIEKQQKFKRHQSTGIFKSEANEGLKKNKVSENVTEMDLSYLTVKHNADELKGISPCFVEFFTSFRTKNADNNKLTDYPSVGPFKRSRVYQRNQREYQSNEKQPSIQNRSQMFMEI